MSAPVQLRDRPVLSKRTVYGHRRMSDGSCIWGPFEIDDHGPAPAEAVRLSEHRVKLGLSLRTAAARLGITAERLSALERGRAEPVDPRGWGELILRMNTE